MNSGSISCHCFHDPKNGEIFYSPDVAAEVERIIAFAQFIESELPLFAWLIFASVDQLIGKERGASSLGVQHKFLLKTFFVGRTGADVIKIIGFVHGEAFIIYWQLLLQLEKEPLVERILEGDAMKRKFFRVSRAP